MTDASNEAVDAAIYESAVKGRQDFRQAYRALLPMQRAAQAISDHWRKPGGRVDSDEWFGLINDLDVAVTGGGPTTPAMRAAITARLATPPLEQSGEVERLIDRLIGHSSAMEKNSRYPAEKPSGLTNADAVSYAGLLKEAATALASLRTPAPSEDEAARTLDEVVPLSISSTWDECERRNIIRAMLSFAALSRPQAAS